jgi:hypothetical protein
MSRPKRGPLPLGEGVAQPFSTTIEAWFWGMAGYLARLDGGRPIPRRGAVPRPCEPGDVVHAALKLARREQLSVDQFRTLVRFGREGLVPDPHLPRQRGSAVLWQAGLDVLAPALRAKGIVA